MLFNFKYNSNQATPVIRNVHSFAVIRIGIHNSEIPLADVPGSDMGFCKVTSPVQTAIAAILAVAIASQIAQANSAKQLNDALTSALKKAGFTGRIESQLPQRLGRPINAKAAELGRLLWFDSIVGLNDDNSCAGCHSPTRAMGDTQPIAIGIDNNGVVGPSRAGPRNQRRSPSVINAAFFPNLMWNSRFSSGSMDPFNNRQGFTFPAPEGSSLSDMPHLLVAQAFIPPTERNEAAGFHFPGDNQAIRNEVLRRLNNISNYRNLFAEIFPEVKTGKPITFKMFGMAIAEFEFTLVFANAPIDRFARGELGAMTEAEKEGALLFFGRADCVSCHAVKGSSNEMFSDFKPRCVGVPQVVPQFTNSVFDGPAQNEDFGLEQVTGKFEDRYKFRTTPLRNVGVQPAFFHNGAYTTLESAIAFHLDPRNEALRYAPVGLPADLQRTGPTLPVLKRLDPRSNYTMRLTATEFNNLVAFVRHGLLDQRALPENLVKLIPNRLPSGRPVAMFQGVRAYAPPARPAW